MREYKKVWRRKPTVEKKYEKRGGTEEYKGSVTSTGNMKTINFINWRFKTEV